MGCHIGHCLNFIRFFAILSDSIWYSINQIAHGRNVLNVQSSLSTVSSLYGEHQEAWQELVRHSKVPWRPPPQIGWKINFDIAMHPSFFVVVVFRNAVGNLLFVWTKSIPQGSPIVGEAREALFAAREVRFFDRNIIILEGHNELICKAINGDGDCSDWHISTLVEDTRLLLNRHPSQSFKWVLHSINLLAHNVGHQ